MEPDKEDNVEKMKEVKVGLLKKRPNLGCDRL